MRAISLTVAVMLFSLRVVSRSLRSTRRTRLGRNSGMTKFCYKEYWGLENMSMERDELVVSLETEAVHACVGNGGSQAIMYPELSAEGTPTLSLRCRVFHHIFSKVCLRRY